MFVRIAILFLCSLPLTLPGQPTTLLDSLEALKNMIKDVQVGKDNYQQELQINKSQPYRIDLIITEIDTKGREERMQFAVNLALIDPNLIHYEDGKDQIRVNLRSASGPVVKVYDNNELDGYDREAYILAFNIDNAREIERILESVIPLAKARWEKDNILPEEFHALSEWVQHRITSVRVDEDQWDQNWSTAEDVPTLVTLRVKDEKGDNYCYRWNLADIHAPSIEVDVKGKLVIIEMGISKRARFIQVEENGELDNYENSLALLFAEVDEAQAMGHALRKLVDLAEEEDASYRPAYEDPAAAMGALQKNLPGFSIDGEKYAQSITGGCLATYELTIDDNKGSETLKAIFDFADLYGPGVEIQVKGKSVSVMAPTVNSADYVYLSEKGEQQNYDDEVQFLVSDLPEAKLIQYQVKQLAEQCSDEIERQDFSWIQTQAEGIHNTMPAFRQQLDLMEDNACKWSFVQEEEKGKKTEVQRLEFNLYDLDAQRVSLDVKGKTVMVNTSTLRNEEIIKVYRNNEELTYTEDLSMLVNDVATGKILAESLKALISNCKED